MKPTILLIAFALAVPFIFRYSLAAMLRRCPDPVPCGSCGIADASRGVYGLCAACAARSAYAEQIERTIRTRAYEADAARRRAQRETERIAARFPLLALGSVYRNERGEPVFEGFEFTDPTGTLPPGPHRVTARQGAGALICGWTPAELHALTHGQSCTCLD